MAVLCNTSRTVGGKGGKGGGKGQKGGAEEEAISLDDIAGVSETKDRYDKVLEVEFTAASLPSNIRYFRDVRNQNSALGEARL